MKKIICKCDINLSIKSIIMGMMTYLAIYTDLNYNQYGESPLIGKPLGLYVSSLKLGSISSIVFLIFLIFFYSISTEKERLIEKERKTRVLAELASVIFSFFTVFGAGMEIFGDFTKLLERGNAQLTKTVISYLGYSIMFYVLMIWVFTFLTDMYARPVIEDASGFFGSIYSILEKKPFLFSFVFFLVVYIPLTVVFYPGIFMGDLPYTILPAFSNSEYYHFNLVPLPYVYFVHLFVAAGQKIFGTISAGVYLFLVFQGLMVIVAMSYTIYFLIRKIKCSRRFAFATILFFSFMPMLKNYFLLLTKDILYTAFLVIFLMTLWDIYRGNTGIKNIMVLVLTGICVFFIRNDSRYLFALFFVLLAVFCKKMRGLSLISIVCIISLHCIWDYGIEPAIGVNEATKSFIYSVPVQQTAACLGLFEEEFTEEDRAVISKVWNYDVLLNNYNPTNSDGVRTSFNRNASKAEIMAYLKLWLTKMVLEHPATCLNATFNNYYSYFYWGNRPFDNSSYAFSMTQAIIFTFANENIGLSIEYPDNETLHNMRLFYDKEFHTLRFFPIISILMTPAFYSWSIIVLWLECIRSKYKQGTFILLVPSIILLICIVSPVHAYYARYMYPIIMLLPFVWSVFRYRSEIVTDKN